MTRITNTEQVLLLLRSHLQRSERNRRRGASAAKGGGKQGPLQRVQELANAPGLSETAIARAMVAGLLTEQFGAAVANDPRFQQMVEEVHGVIERDEAGRDLLRKAVTALTDTKT